MRIDVRLEVILEYEIHRRHFGVHNDDRQRDTFLAQFDTLVGDSDSEVID